MRNINKLFKIISALGLSGALLIPALSVSAASPSDHVKSAKKVHQTQSVIITRSQKSSKTITVKPNGTITVKPNGLTGGGYLTCHVNGGTAECGASLTNTERMYGYYLKLYIYSRSGGSAGLVVGSDVAQNYDLGGVHYIYPTFDTIILAPGKYDARISGEVYTYLSDIPEQVRSIWAPKFTVN